jgi:non-ribosomal peptide synthetase-like protein
MDSLDFSRTENPNSTRANSRHSVLSGPKINDILTPKTLRSIFAARLNATPDAPAVRFEGKRLSYAEMDACAEPLAQALLSLGAGPGRFIGICFDRGLDMHVAVLAIIKSGAAWVPIDSGAPSGRIADCLEGCGALLCLCDETTQAAVLDAKARGLTLKELGALVGHGAHHAQNSPVDPDDPAYVIFTSGSTGKPKGVCVSQANIAHFVASENAVLGITQHDRVFQGFSPAFDMWLEETWIAIYAGAELVIAPGCVAREADRLPDLWDQNDVTIVHAVPSLIAMLDRIPDSIRLLNLGGEACPPALSDRLARPGLTIFNTYGPTETTVTATAAKLEPGAPITIGGPLPNYSAYVVDDGGELVEWGGQGELWIGGPGVTMGYVGRPDLTEAKFIANPFSDFAKSDPKLYRSGDLVSLDHGGNIIFHGRIDDQVKLRGYRIELGEIETVLSGLPGIRAAAVGLRADVNGDDQLIAWVAGDGDGVSPTKLRQGARKNLPSYMIPSAFVRVEALPRLTSGKIDRKALLDPSPDMFEAGEAGRAPQTPLEIALADAWSQAFKGRTISVDQDFFDDLGGHSLVAATAVSIARKKPGLETLSLRDLYEMRTVAKLAIHVGAQTSQSFVRDMPEQSPTWRRWVCGTFQGLALVLLFGLLGVQVVGPWVTYAFVEEWTNSEVWGALSALGALALAPGLVLALVVGLKWLVLGQSKPGNYPLWGVTYFRHWFVARLLDQAPARFFANTPAAAVWWRLLGAKIGKHTDLGSLSIGAPDLVTIGDHVAIGSNVRLDNTGVRDGRFIVGTVNFADHAIVGSSAVVGLGADISSYGELNDLSALPDFKHIPNGQVWGGSPARFKAEAEPVEPPEPLSAAQELRANLGMAAWTIIFPLAALVPVLPAIVALNRLDSAAIDGDFKYLWLAPVIALSFVILFVTQAAISRRLALGRNLQPGTWNVTSGFYRRKWFADQMMELALEVLHPLYATLYTVPFYRLLGAKVGVRSEISTATSLTHELVEIGDESFIADGAVFADSSIRHGRLTLKRTSIGARAFIGNSAFVPDGTNIPDGCMIGVLSTPPPSEDPRFVAGSTWFGTPAVYLPKRQSFDGHDEGVTFNPSRGLVVSRLIIETLRILAPGTLFVILITFFTAFFYDVVETQSAWVSLLAFPVYVFGLVGLPAFLTVVALKWLVVGRYQPTEAPMWSSFVWRSEAVTAIYEASAVPLFLNLLRGTPFIAPALRLLGVKIGQGTVIDTTDFTEFDCVSIGDEAVLSCDCGPQTHLFEDRVMKVGAVSIGAQSQIGAGSIVLYGASLEQGAALGPHSLLMKGEAIPAQTYWCGSPAQPGKA